MERKDRERKEIKMDFKNYDGRLEDVAAYAITGRIEGSVYVLESGNKPRSISRISLVDKETGKEYLSGFTAHGAEKEEDFQRIEEDLMLSLYAGERVKKVYSKIESRASPRVIHHHQSEERNNRRVIHQGGFRLAR